MALAYDAQRQAGKTMPAAASTARVASPRAGRAQGANTISASQARAARRREAMSHQQAVAAWLRELSRPTR
jgi:hypothetical protein